MPETRIYRVVKANVHGEVLEYLVSLTADYPPAAVGITLLNPPDRKELRPIVLPLKDWPRIVAAVAELQQQTEIYPDESS